MDPDVSDLLAAAERSRQRFIRAVTALGPAAATRVVEEGRWTAGQYAEHLVRAEEATIWRMWGALEGTSGGGEGVVSETPGLSIEEVVAGTWRAQEQAPPLAVPALGGAVAYWLERLRLQRPLLAALGARLRPADLDSLAYRHPISGPLTLRQALQFIRFHLDRHRGHVEEIAALAGDPETPGRRPPARRAE